MTYSDAWIEAGDDDDFAKFLDQTPRIGVMPPPGKPYWIAHVKNWAQRESLAIEHPDYNVVRVHVTKTQLQRFMQEMLGHQLHTGDPATLVGYVWHKCHDDRTYVIGADEY